MNPAPGKNYYSILEVDHNASAAVIQGAYRALLKNARNHPDLGGSEEVAQVINEAYAVLSNPSTRREYDSLLTFSPAIDVELPETRFILICPSCRNSNQLRDERSMRKARCGACGHLLVPRGRIKKDDDPERVFRLGIYLFDKRMYDRALREFETATRIKPRTPSYHYWLGRCYYQKAMLEKSRSAFQAAAVVDPDQFHFQFWLGQTCYALKDFAGAAKGFAKAMELRSGHAPTLLKLSSCYFRLRQYKQAAATLEIAVEQEPARPQPQIWLGLSHLASDNTDAALAAFRKAQELSPGNATIEKYIRICEGN